ncbi:MAG TPA: Gfo/Idh/MocA family oxidoreductase [Phycisphaerae bacterium]|nr:Gfo/Idh/MocA family oxidoreductase [Phycisphaerae bacterium]
MSPLSRRGFLKNSLVAAGGAALFSGCASAAGKAGPGRAPATKVRGANEKIRVAVAGLNGRGKSHYGAFAGMENVEVVCLVDPDTRLFGPAVKAVEAKGHNQPATVQDIRRVLDDKDIDVVSIATPNHWHSLMTIWACQAGKDVYVEKPMSHNIHEGRIAVETARKYGRIVQHGTQSRSEKSWAKAVAAVHSGKLGKLLITRALCYKAGGGESTRGSIGWKPYKTPPRELDFNIWLGPAREQPYHENLVHYRWHWFWDFGNGDLGNQGVHQMDIARWSIKGATLPRSVVSFGGRLGYYDQGEVASTQMAIMDFGDTKLIFETRGLPSEKYRGVNVGNIFHLEAGTLIEGKFYPNGSDQPVPLPDVEYRLGPGNGPFANFIAAVRSRKVSDLNADVLEGHYSSACCHLCNMSIRLGGKTPFRPRAPYFDTDPDAAEVLERTEQYLAANGVKIEESGYTLGRKLMVDAAAERIIGDEDANAMLTRHYRAGFVVPEKV